MIKTEYSLDDLELMPGDALHRELLEGELIELPPPEFVHSRIARAVFRSLDRYCQSLGSGEVFLEAGYRITADKRNWIQPDVSFIAEKRLDERGKYLAGAPDLAVEIISPSERPKDILGKRELLFRAGCKEIWIIRPQKRRIEIWMPGRLERELGETGTLSSPLFEGWSMPVSELMSAE